MEILGQKIYNISTEKLLYRLYSRLYTHKDTQRINDLFIPIYRLYTWKRKAETIKKKYRNFMVYKIVSGDLTHVKCSSNYVNAAWNSLKGKNKSALNISELSTKVFHLLSACRVSLILTSDIQWWTRMTRLMILWNLHSSYGKQTLNYNFNHMSYSNKIK